MKKSNLYGAVVIVLGLLIALGPQFLFKVCGHGEDSFPLCHWSAQAEIGMGMIIIAFGICFIVFNDPRTQFGLMTGVFLTGIIALSIPNVLIGGCGSMVMTCRRIGFPALTIESIILLVFTAIVAFRLDQVSKKHGSYEPQ